MSTIFKDDNGNWVQTIRPNWALMQTVSYDGSVACSNPLPKDCTLAMLWSTTDSCFNLAASPTAAVSNTSVPLTAKTYYYLPVGTKGLGSGLDNTDKVAFIKQVTAGTAWIVPCF